MSIVPRPLYRLRNDGWVALLPDRMTEPAPTFEEARARRLAGLIEYYDAAGPQLTAAQSADLRAAVESDQVPRFLLRLDGHDYGALPLDELRARVLDRATLAAVGRSEVAIALDAALAQGVGSSAHGQGPGGAVLSWAVDQEIE